MGFFGSLGNVLLGGMGASTNPADYKVPYAHQGQIEELINQGLSQVHGRTAPQLNTGPQDQFRNQQFQQIGQLGRVASGQQAGAGELAVNRQIQNALAGQQAMAHMRGAGGMGMRTAARQGAALGLSGAGMAQQAQMQDAQAANGLMAGISQAGRGADIGIAGQNAQLQQQGQQMNDQQYMQLLSQLGLMDANQLQAQTAAMGAATQKPGLLGGLLSAGGQIGGAAIQKWG